MKKISYILVGVSFFVFIFGTQLVYSQTIKHHYGKAIRSAKHKQYDFAFMELRALIRDFPENSYTKDAIFAIGEYFYLNKMYGDAIGIFRGYVEKYPQSDGAIFAKVYLLKIMEDIKNPTPEEKIAMDNIKMDIFSEPLFLLFSEYKEGSYKSVFQNCFRVRHYIDRIEVYRNNEIFITITP